MMHPDYYANMPSKGAQAACVAPSLAVCGGDPTPGVHEAVDRSRKGAMSLAEAIEALTNRLTGVLRPEPPGVGCEAGPRAMPSVSPMAEALNEHAAGLYGLADRVASLLRRLDL